MDSKRLAEIADVMEGRGLTRVRVEEPDGSAVELERGGAAQPVAVPVPMGAVPAVPAAAAPAPASEQSAPSSTGAAAPAETAPAPAPASGREVTAPMVGVFYAAPAPDAEPFVAVGSKVKAGETLCIIEAMKVLNEVAAEADGVITEICAKDGELVEFGSCLMKVEEVDHDE